MSPLSEASLLGGSWVVISGVTSKGTIVISPIGGLITHLLMTTHEPPSKMGQSSTFTALKMDSCGRGGSGTFF